MPSSNTANAIVFVDPAATEENLALRWSKRLVEWILEGSANGTINSLRTAMEDNGFQPNDLGRPERTVEELCQSLARASKR